MSVTTLFYGRLWHTFCDSARDKANYVNGITPDFTLSERNLISLYYPLGDTKEYLLKNTIAYTLTGSMPDLPQTEKNKYQKEKLSITH